MENLLQEFATEDVWEEVDNTLGEQNHQRRRVTYIRSDRYSNEQKRNIKAPELFCAVCCRILYAEEACSMSADAEAKLVEFLQENNMTWPVLMYKDGSGASIQKLKYTDAGRIVVCASHKSSGNNSIATIKALIQVLNTDWCYPGDTPKELKNLHPGAESFLSPIMVFCELTNRLSAGTGTRATRAGYHFVNGRIGLYSSSSYLGDYAGTRGMIRNQDGIMSRYTEEDLSRIIKAYTWLREKNNIFKDRMPVDAASLMPEVPELIRTYQQEARVDVNKSAFRDELMMPVYDGGPRTADEENAFENIVLGVDDSRKLVKYGNPRLMGYLFPTLYVEGKGFYSLNYKGIDETKATVIQHHEVAVNLNHEGNVEIGDVDWENDMDAIGIDFLADVDNPEADGDDDDDIEIDNKDDAKGGSSAYSRTTLKAYAKFRLLSVDRRFGTSTKYIFMLFDWAQKNAVFGFHNRRAPVMLDGRKTSAKDVREGSEVHSGVRYNQLMTVSIPSTIRTGVKYKQELFCRFTALFDKFKTPQLFGTYTCDDQDEGQIKVAGHFHGEGTPTHKDPVLFVNHWKRKWHSFFKFVRTVWADVCVDGLKAYCWVLEVQDRGTPHTHYCLWTNCSIQEMISREIISCRSVGETQEQTDLIMRHQVHKCGSYCASEYRDGCRFGYPYAPSERTTYFDVDKKRFVYQRGDQDSRINGYNILLLRYGRVNMDLQYNQGSEVKRYMCKYITKQAAIHKATIAQDRNQSMNEQHVVSDAYVKNFHYRSVSVTEAIMDLCGWSMSQVSHAVIYLATEAPENRQYLLKRAKDLGKLDKDDSDIFLPDKWTKYLQRPANTGSMDFEHMSYKEFYEDYHHVKVKDKKRMFKDKKNRDVCQRMTPAIVRSRTLNVTNSEDAFMHLLMLHWPTRMDVDKWIGDGTRYLKFQDLAVVALGRDLIATLAPGLLIVIDFGSLPEVPADPDVTSSSIDLTVDQMEVYDEIKSRLLHPNGGCAVLVTGAAGTGKSTLLRIISDFGRRNGYHPIMLAPSGVAAVNVRGETIHRWFRISRMSKGSFFVGNPYSVREQLIDMSVKAQKPLLLVDEASMISGKLLSTMESTLSSATHVAGSEFGGIAIIFFGDFGQLAPVNRSQRKVDWFWKSESYEKLKRFDLVTPCRQSTDMGFKSFLDDVRKGTLEISSAQVFVDILRNSGKRGAKIPEDAIRLMTHRKQVDSFNTECLDRLPGETWTSIAQDDGGYIKDQGLSENIASETGLLSLLSLKVGAMVMCTSNINVSQGLVNGTVGKVTRIHEGDIIEIETDLGRRFRIGKEYRTTGRGNHERYQLPLVPSWAITIHKAQSLTLAKVAVSLKNVFSSGQAYVALSRVRTRGDLYILDCDLKKMLRVPHSVMVRLTKVSEAAITDVDRLMEAMEDEERNEDGANLAIQNFKESNGIFDFGDYFSEEA